MNLIQSYRIEPNTYITPNKNQSKPDVNFDVNKELANHTFIRPLPAHGKLVKNGIFDMPSEFIKDMRYNYRALKHSIKGEANDHELGRLNDMGMKLGGLAIATYLFSRKATPLTKIMEFVGLTSFFAAMDLWPKIALQIPAYLIHGFNIRQEYIDNYGRKKMVYLDHQFIPWDLYSDEDINKIGNKLHVPKDIPNRREFIQEKMRKIALQNNTMWMLTAGFATPIMSALICNACEKPIQRYQDARLNKKANNLLINFNKETEKINFKDNVKNLEKILEENKDKTISPELLKKIYENLSENLDPAISKYLEADLINLIPNIRNYSIRQETIKNVHTQLTEHFSQLSLPAEVTDSIIPNTEELIQLMREKNALNDNAADVSEYSKFVQELVNEKIDKYIQQNPDNIIGKKLKFHFKKYIHSQNYREPSKLNASFKYESSAKLTDNLAEAIKNISKTLNTFKAQVKVLDKYAFIKAAEAPETIHANIWNLDLCNDLLKVFNFTPEEIRQSRLEPEIAGKILREKMEDIVSDDNKYTKFLDTMNHKLSTMYNKMESIDLSATNNTNTYINCTNTSYDTAAESLRRLKMPQTADIIAGYQHCEAHEAGKFSAKLAQLEFMENSNTALKSSMYRLFNTMSVFRKISKLPQNGSEILDYQDGKPVLRQVKEEMLEAIKELLISGHASDYANKLYVLRSLDVNPEDIVKDFNLKTPEEKEQIINELTGQIETHKGKVINKYLGTKDEKEMKELSNDYNFFKKIMKYIYEENPDAQTIEKCENSVFWKDFIEYRKDALNILGGDFNFAKPGFVVNGVVESTSERRFIRTGSALDEMFFNLTKQEFNNKYWLKKFGRFGIGLIAVTVIAQFFMGKMPKVSSKEGK